MPDPRGDNQLATGAVIVYAQRHAPRSALVRLLAVAAQLDGRLQALAGAGQHLADAGDLLADLHAADADSDRGRTLADAEHMGGEGLAHAFGHLRGVRVLALAEQGEAVLAEARQLRLLVDGAGQVLAEATGWEIPVEQLPDWVRGLPAQGAIAPEHLGFDAEGRPRVLRQQGWQVDYLDWYPAEAGRPALPRRIEAVNGDAKVRLIVDEWSIGAP